MNVYLLPFAGSGTAADRYRPQGVDPIAGTQWFSLDLRPDAGVQAGRCIVGTTATIDVSGIGNGRQLGADLDDTIPTLIRTFLRNQLNLQVGDDAPTPRGLIRNLFTLLGRSDGTRWQNIQTYRSGGFDVHEVWLGGLVFQDLTPVVSGGADFTNDFNRADGTAVGNPTTLTEVVDNWTTVSNRGSNGTSGGTTDGYMRDDTNLPVGNDQYAQIAVFLTVHNGDNGGTTVRMASGSFDCYWNLVGDLPATGTAQQGLGKTIGGAESFIGSQTGITFVGGQAARVEVQGSTLRGYYNGTLLQTASDSSLTSGRCGVIGINAVAGQTTVDDLAFGDLSTGLDVPLLQPPAQYNVHRM